MEVHLVEKNKSKRVTNVEVLTEFANTALVSVAFDRAQTQLGLMARILPGYSKRLRATMLVELNTLYQERLKMNLNTKAKKKR